MNSNRTSFLDIPKKSMAAPIKFDKQLREPQGFMSLRKRSQSEYNTVTCEPENSLSSGKNSKNF